MINKVQYCEYCILIPEMERIPLVWEHSGPGIGEERCPLCKWLYGAYNCPYIPQDLLYER